MQRLQGQLQLCLHLLQLAHHCLCFLIQSGVVGDHVQPAMISKECESDMIIQQKLIYSQNTSE